MAKNNSIGIDQFIKLIRVLEDALEKTAAILDLDARPAARSHEHIQHPYQFFEELSDLLDATRSGQV